MIKKLKIHNVQSHKDTELEFSSGVNAIVGSSNNGKSAILRALYWVRYNRPLGIDTLLSHWAYDKKGNQLDSMSVCIENDVGTVERKRTKTENQYIVNDEILNVVKTDVPEQVESVLRLNDTNIQKQQDTPFLLSLSSSQVAQYFNKVVRLDIIDKVLSNAENKRRKVNQELNVANDLFLKSNEKLKQYEWLENAKKLFTKFDNVNLKLLKIQNDIEFLESLIFEYDKYFEINDKYKFLTKSKKLISEYDDVENSLIEIDSRLNVLCSTIDDYDEYSANKRVSFDVSKKIIVKIESVDLSDINDRLLNLKSMIDEFDDLTEFIDGNKNEVVKLKSQLPKICPLCGGILNDC